MYSVDGPHVVGLEEIDSLKVAANNLYSDGRFGQAIIGEFLSLVLALCCDS